MNGVGIGCEGGKKMYRVESFLPTNCPKCHVKFESEGKDWSRFLGDIVEGHKKIRETKGYVIIICEHCGNFTAQTPIKTYCLSSEEEARKLLDQGFVNIIEVISYGNMTQDHYSVAELSPPRQGFCPPKCPKCNHEFKPERDDFSIDDVIICSDCSNYTAYGQECEGLEVKGISCE